MVEGINFLYMNKKSAWTAKTDHLKRTLWTKTSYFMVICRLEVI